MPERGPLRARWALGLRAQILVALLLVTLGAIISVGAITVSQTRLALSAERHERVALLADQAALLAGQVLDGVSGDELRARFAAAARDLARALGAAEIVLFDERARVVWPEQAAVLASDGRGVTAAVAGLAPHAEARPPERGEPEGLRLIAYAPTRRGGKQGRAAHVVRTTFALDESVDGILLKARRSVILLGALDGLLLLIAAAWILRGAVVRPVQALEKAAVRVASGDLGVRLDVRGPGELGRLADAFDRMTHSLRTGRESLIRSEKLASVGRLAAGVAHEVGNPLAAILGYIEMLLSETPERPIDPLLRREMLERVRSETERIHNIVKELLDYARPPREELEAVDVRKVVEGAVSLARATSRSRGVTWVVEIPNDMPAVRSGTGRVTQVMLNLLLNAADATDGKGTVVIDARQVGDHVVVGVTDNGPGVPQEARAHVFDPFFSTKEPGHGTGLGLSVTQAIVEAHGGVVRLCDAPAGQGARFEVVLPAWGSRASGENVA